MSKTIDPNQGDADGTVTTPGTGTSRTLEALKVRIIPRSPIKCLSNLDLEESGLTQCRILSVFRPCHVLEKVCCMVLEQVQALEGLGSFPVVVSRRHSRLSLGGRNLRPGLFVFMVYMSFRPVEGAKGNENNCRTLSRAERQKAQTEGQLKSSF
ncbi:hypothetical protein AG1IA_07003 [Rhizoctonia solani AG-1 IA]|uniref:Uncharacterized protein n=1 Tax=Thanatephorus cucumeris (strain AG1-IA) TaxID=983506 RepID=L8WRG6_THACA|nr:hypothetical protein AG1IA_07003 [Rhizoctonia solani AG-1 IA]